MQILFDNIIFSKEKQGGISNYWYQIIRHYESDKNVYFYEESNAHQNIFRSNLNIKNCIPHKQLPVTLARILPIRFTTTADFLLYHSSFYRRLSTNAKPCEVTTVHDFIHSAYSSGLKKIIHNKLKFDTIKRAAGIICVSNFTFSDLKKYYSLKKKQKVTVIYNGVSSDFKPITEPLRDTRIANSFILDERYLLFVGARSGYKNFDFTISLLKSLPEYKLVIAGNALSENEKIKIGKELLSRIIEIPSASNIELNILYNYAHALVYPSSHEGFGIPVVEAMKAGCPVLALNKTSIPEVAGGAAKLFDKLILSDFLMEINQLDEKRYREDQVQKGIENAQRFNWEKCFNQTSEFYKDVYNSCR